PPRTKVPSSAGDRLPSLRRPPRQTHVLGGAVVSAQINVTVPGSERTVDVGTTAGDLFEGRREVVVARVGGDLWDLHHELAEGDTVEPVTVESEDGLAVLRHSCAHVLAQAVQ